MPNRALRLLRIVISNRVHSAVVANVKKVRPADMGEFDRSMIARLLDFRARAMTVQPDERAAS